jgi:RNA polymerase subunit RPABC4/transcription elongation factor Spt4
MINDNYDNFNNLKILSMVCRNCKRELPEEQFELYPTGTRRKVCRHCHYELHTKKGRRKWVMKQRARALLRYL